MRNKITQNAFAKLIDGINNSKHKELNWSVIAYLFFGLLLALFLPEDISLNKTYIGRFCSMIVATVPSISNYAKISDFPDVATVFFSVMWVLTPFMLVIMVLSLAPRKMPDWVIKCDWKMIPKVFVGGVFAILFCLLFIYLFVYMPVDLAEKVKPDELINRAKAINIVMSGSRIGLAMYGGLLVLATVVFATMLIAHTVAVLFAIYVFFSSIFNFFKRK